MNSLRKKYFLSLLFLIIISLLLFALVLNWSLDRYFFDYQLQERAQELEDFESYLNVIYESENDLRTIREHIEEYAALHNLIYHPAPRRENGMMHDHQDSRGHSRMRDMVEEGYELFVGGRSIGHLTWPEENNESLLAAEITERTNEFRREIYGILLPLGLGLTVLAILFSYYISKKLTEPLSGFTTAVKEIKEGDYEVELKEDYPQELQHLYKEIKQLSQRLNYLAQIRKESVLDLSHEIRTPLNNILNYLTALDDGYLEFNKEIINDLKEETQRLEELSNRLDDLSMAEKKIFNNEQKEVNLKAFFSNLSDKFNRRAENNNLNYSQKITVPDKIYLLDLEALEIIMENLFSNALKYTGSGGKIILQAEIKAGKLTVQLEDSGIGIAEEEQELIFERFYRTDKSRSQETGGTGIGLAITKELIEYMQGNISLESSEKGSIFKFEIPLQKGRDYEF